MTSQNDTAPIVPASVDRAIGFTIASRNARGRIARLGQALEDVLSAHAYPPVIEKLLAEALVLTSLLGSTLKNDAGQLTLQAQTKSGVVKLLVADYTASPDGGVLRGYAQFDAERLVELSDAPTLAELFDGGYLAITFDQAAVAGLEAQRFQGIVPLEGDTLGAAVEHYFYQSEQIPSFVRIDTRRGGDGVMTAGGMLVQHLPIGEVGRERLHVQHDHPEWEHIQMLASTLRAEELTDGELGLDDILWRLFHEEDEVRISKTGILSHGCRCNENNIRSVLASFPLEERQEMADEAGNINVDCSFCGRIYPISLGSLVN